MRRSSAGGKVCFCVAAISLEKYLRRELHHTRKKVELNSLSELLHRVCHAFEAGCILVLGLVVRVPTFGKGVMVIALQLQIDRHRFLVLRHGLFEYGEAAFLHMVVFLVGT
jgi:hypothetical protein